MPSAELHKVDCPYCGPVGYTEIVAEKVGGAIQIRDFNEPRRCVMCKRFFTLKYRVRIVGAALEASTTNGKVAS